MEPWATELLRGHTDVAWDLFLSRYRRLVFATIRHVVRDPDDVMDVFAAVLESLRAADHRRLRNYLAEPDHRARFSTWLVVVVRHLAIDWLRGRTRRAAPPVAIQGLSPLEQSVFALAIGRRAGHAETYELLRSGAYPGLSPREFRAALRKVYQAVGRGPRRAGGRDLPGVVEPEAWAALEEGARAASGRALRRLLSELPPEDRVLLGLYVVQGAPASAVARVLGLPGAKAVYNRAYRLLAGLRARLDAEGMERGEAPGS